MAHSEILTASEYATWQPNQLILQFIRTSQQEMGVSLEDFRILDWGCGRGRYLLPLRKLGYQVYGADISQLTKLQCA